MNIKIKNPVAKFSKLLNRSKKMRDKKLAYKRGEIKHKNRNKQYEENK